MNMNKYFTIIIIIIDEKIQLMILLNVIYKYFIFCRKFIIA